MRDPLHDFDWSLLYDFYDAKCQGRFKRDSEHLGAIDPRPRSDRQLYYYLVDHIRMADRKPSGFSIDVYKALLYWKLYSTSLVHLGQFRNERIRTVQSDNLESLLCALPPCLARNADDVMGWVKELGRYEILGMKSATALPVRTTFLHFLFPNVVPILDKMVLQAVGLWRPRANEKMDSLREYLPIAWGLTDQYSLRLHGWRETPVRLIDMALWVVRGGNSTRSQTHREVRPSWKRPGLKLVAKGASLSAAIIEERRREDVF
jgi:hypothetical protein